MPKLIILEGSDQGTEVPLGDGVVSLGRDPEVDVVLGGEELVSPLHASLRQENTRWFVEDEKSTFGTFVNRRRVKEQGLRDGDVLELGLGGPTLRFEAGADERERGAADTAGRLKQYYEEMSTAEDEAEPLEGAGEFAFPVGARGALLALAGVAVAVAAAVWFTTSSGTEADPGVGTVDPAVRPGGVLYDLDRTSRAFFAELGRLRGIAQGAANGAGRRDRSQGDLRALESRIDAGVATGSELDSLEARREEIEADLAVMDRLSEMGSAIRPSLVLVQTGFRVDGRYFPGPTGTGFFAGEGGRLVTSRHLVEPHRYVGSDGDADLACAVADLLAEGKQVVPEVAVWTTRAEPAHLESGALDPSSATATTSDGGLELVGSPPAAATEVRSCSGGTVADSLRPRGDLRDLALLSLSGSAGEPLPLASRDAREDEFVLVAGFPRGYLAEGEEGLPGWASYGPVVEAGGLVLFDLALPEGVEGGPILNASGEVLGMGTASRDGKGVAIGVATLRSLLSAF